MELRALHRHGWSIPALAREFNLDRRTVSRYVDLEEPAGYGPVSVPTKETFWNHYHRELGH